MIYFAQPVDGGLIKIGHSANVLGRLRQLEDHYKHSLSLLGTLPGGFQEERELHKRFLHLRYGPTEQFRPDPELLEFIGSACASSSDPELAETFGDQQWIPGQRRPKGRPKLDNPKVSPPIALTVRGRAEWSAYFESHGASLVDQASGTKPDRAAILDAIIRELAKLRGWPKPPSRV